MSEEQKGWNERRFAVLHRSSPNPNPANPMPEEPKEPESYLPNLKTNPARYGDDPPPPTPPIGPGGMSPFSQPAPGGSGDNPPPTTPAPNAGLDPDTEAPAIEPAPPLVP